MKDQDFLLPAFDNETAVTRRLLERLPEDALAWRPHERSYTLGELASHLAQLLGWGRSILEDDRHDLASGTGQRPPDVPSRAALLERFDAQAADLRRQLVAMERVQLDVTWSLTRGAQVLLEAPRHAAFRRFVIDHLIHHRGQLSVYLRLRDVPLPPMYGPTADAAP